MEFKIAKFWQDRKLDAKLDPDQLISILGDTVSVSKNGIYLGSAGQGLI